MFVAELAGAGLEGLAAYTLRHVFAMVMLVRLQAEARQKPEINPLKVLQTLLGQTSIQPAQVCLRCVELCAYAVAGAIHYLFGSVLSDAE